MASFLESIAGFFKLQPYHRPKNLRARRILRSVLPRLCTSFDLIVGKRTALPKKTFKLENKSVNREHDKDPDTFFEILYVLIKEGLHFRVSVLGEQFSEVPPVFGQSKEKLVASRQCDIVDYGDSSLGASLSRPCHQLTLLSRRRRTSSSAFQCKRRKHTA